MEVTARTLAAALVALFALDNLLLPGLLGMPIAPLAFSALPIGTFAAWLLARAGGLGARITFRTLAAAFSIALVIFILGGEGRIFYANPDWQVRDAVLADLAKNPWPYAYDIDGWKAILRAPLGLYLAPALTGRWHEIALLLSNATRLGLILALASTLFNSVTARLTGLAVFVAFSGWDVIGNAVMSMLDGPRPWDHLEQWNPGSQYSSTLTLAFWVPNHAIAGWTCAVTYLLWLRRQGPVGLFAVTIPLTALWSPLAAIGVIPFALHAGVRVILERSWTYYDLTLGALGLAVAIPSLWYLQLDVAAVGGGWRPIPLLSLALLMALEVAPFAVPLYISKRLQGNEEVVHFLILLCLMVMPMLRVGSGIDFQMRASIVPLALLAFVFAEWIVDLRGTRMPNDTRLSCSLMLAVAILAVGAATPMMEIKRALSNDPSPAPRCSLAGAWKSQTGTIAPYDSYFAALNSLPRWMMPVPITAGPGDPARCWDRKWVPINRL